MDDVIEMLPDLDLVVHAGQLASFPLGDLLEDRLDVGEGTETARRTSTRSTSPPSIFRRLILASSICSLRRRASWMSGASLSGTSSVSADRPVACARRCWM